MPETRAALCMLCEAACGLEVEFEDKRVSRIRGDKASPSRGHICPKGVAIPDIQNDPDRVTSPIKREPDGSWVPVPWETALADIGERMGRIQERHGKDALAFYFGNPTGHSYTALLAGIAFHQTLGSRNVFSSQSVDALPRVFVSWLLYGNQAIIPVPDMDRTQLLVIMGANPVVSNGSAMCSPGIEKRLRDLKARGGRLVVIDPRRTETAELADEHLALRPGSDAALLAAILHTLFARGWVVEAQAAAQASGVDKLRRAVEPFSPEGVAAFVGVQAEAIVSLAQALHETPRAVIYGRMGTCVQPFGALATWLIDAVNLLTGHMDVLGGAMFATPAVDLAGLASTLGQTGAFNRWQSRVGGRPEFNGELPVAAFAEELETPGKGQIKGLIVHAGNPVLSLPNGKRLARAFDELELMVAVDIYRNETTRHAHYILPPSFGFEHDQFALLSQALGVRNTVQYAPALMPPPAECRHDFEILGELCVRLAKARSPLLGRVARWGFGVLKQIGPARVLDLLLRFGPHGLRLQQLLATPSGLDLGPLEPRLAQVVRHPDGKVQLAAAPLLGDLARLEAAVAKAVHPTLSLITRRTLRSNNSWMHNSQRLVKGKPRCTLEIHPRDAKQRNLSEGGLATVRTAVGQVTLPVTISERMRPGVVSMPHGFGHDLPGSQLRVAKAHPGVCINDVCDDSAVEGLTHTGVLSGIEVEVQAAVTQDAREPNATQPR
ncbi:MAG TPA: molybdopterin-dependent oxidoreductase [Polyangiaceae bacterium]|nr:molybdopterin-dependent oxidoreductase [Polyangiaceae bacterium]HMR73716.1 molybdopterin-dependent oxidoreductase [Polyangiaceae bacterium]